MEDWLGLAGRPTLIVGAGGLGGASALSMADLGARVVLADVDKDKLDRVADASRLGDGDVTPLHWDVRGPEHCRALVDEACRLFGASPQVFLHAVGRNVRKAVVELDDDDWMHTVTLNLSTAYWLGQAVGREMVAAGYGRMVFMSSVSGLLAHAGHAPYAAAKGGLNQMLRVMAREWASHGVTVNAVAPGYVETDLTRDYLKSGGQQEALESLIPAGRLGRPAEVADAVAFLASDRAAFITGHVLYIDGGRVLV